MFKLATWNLMKPVSQRRREIMRGHMDRENADVWVLTETHDGFNPGHTHTHSHSSSPGRDNGTYLPEHRCVTIWSKFPAIPLVTTDKERTAATRITDSTGATFIVYGTVLPWVGSKWREHPSAGGVAFREALATQLNDWMRLRKEYPDDEFFVLGDFNQELVLPRYYGSRANHTALEAALKSAGLRAVTAGDGDPVRRHSAPCACIDHICVRRDSKWQVESTVRWPDVPVPERWLTDHFGVAAVLTKS